MRADGSGGFFLLLTESFAVRAMLGSLAAAGLVYFAVLTTSPRTRHARRLLILAPVTVAAVAAVASVGEAFLPARLWVATTAGGSAAQILDFLGESWFLTPQREVDVLLIAWALIAGVLLTRRFVGAVTARRLVATGRPPVGYGNLVRIVARLSESMGIRTPELLVLPRCPGGALTARIVNPVVVVDPYVLDGLDEREAEALLAHELAHIRRRDNLVAGMIGVFRDLTFFLPPVHLAARWLRLEREESADELACAHTHRPAAMASGILKVWDTCRLTRRPIGCAVIGNRPIALAGIGAVTAIEVLEQRVERLIEPAGTMTRMRQRVEVGVASAVTAAAVTAAISVPAWVVSRYDAAAIAIGYLAAPPVADVESPVFTTFRRLAPDDTATAVNATTATESGRALACPCVETRSQWTARQPVTVPASSSSMAWGSADRAVWDLRSLAGTSSPDARPLLTVSQPAQHVGFFVLGAAPQSP